MSLAFQDALALDFVFLSSVPLLVVGESIVVITALVAASLTSRYASRTSSVKGTVTSQFSRRRGDDRWLSLRGGAGR